MRKNLAALLAAGQSRSRWTVAVAVVGLLLLLSLGAAALAHIRSSSSPVASVTKATTCDDLYRVLSLAPSQVAAAKQVCLVESLKFSGEITGEVAQAYPASGGDIGPAPMCTEPKRWDDFPAAVLAMNIQGKAYRLRISVPGKSEHQAVTLNTLQGVVDLASVKDPNSDWNQATGTLTLNPQGVGGSIDADISRDVAGAHPVHVAGDWTCGAPLQQPAAAVATPCGLFYSLNQLAPADIARMKAQACNAQKLVFSGDLVAEVDYGLTDRAYVFDESEITDDNECGQAYGRYTATIKFAIGDENFLLTLIAYADPTVTPGTYPAAGRVYPNVDLSLGTVDASKHGILFVDQRLGWSATQGTLTIAPGLKSGTIDADLAGGFDPSQPFSHVHVSGTWRCAA